MVEEKFKIGIDVEVAQESLSQITRDIEKAVKQAFDKATKAGAGRPAGAAGRATAPPGGGSATAASIKKAIDVAGKNLAGQIQKAFSDELQGFEAASKRVEDAVGRLAKVMEGKPAQTKAPRVEKPAATVKPTISKADLESALGKGSAEAKDKRKETKALQAVARTLEKRATGAGEAGNEKLAGLLAESAKLNRAAAKRSLVAAKIIERAVTKGLATIGGPPAQRISGDPHATVRRVAGKGPPGASREQKIAAATRQENIGRSRAGAAATRTSDGRSGDPIIDDRSRAQDRAKKAGARVGGGAGADPMAALAAQQKQAAMVVKNLNNTLDAFEAKLRRAFPGREDLVEKAMPGRAEVGPGASVIMRGLNGQVKIVTSVLEVVEGKLKSFGSGLDDTLKGLMTAPEGGKSAMEGYALSARRRPERTLSRVQGDMRRAMDLPVRAEGKVMQAYGKAGEAQLKFTPTKEEGMKLGKIKTEAQLISEVNKLLAQSTDLMAELAKHGVELVQSLGLSEATAAKIQVQRGEGGEITGIEMPVQTRETAMGVGGRGAMNAARTHLVTQILEMVGGEVPKIMGSKMQSLMEAGEIKPKAVRHLKTAFVGTAQAPELKEDMISLATSVKMAAAEIRTTHVQKVEPGLQVGQRLEQGQVIGQTIDQEDITFDAKGVDAEITELETIIIDGIEGVKITLKEVMALATGEKITTLGGFKGVIRRHTPEQAEQMGVGRDVEAIVSAEGMAKRGIQTDAIAMMASTIAEKVGVSGQEVADKIEAAMTTSGKGAAEDIAAAVTGVAESYGMKDFTGGEGGALTGQLAWARLEQPAGGEREQRFFDLPTMRGLQQSVNTEGITEDWIAATAKVMASNEGFVTQLLSLAGATDVASEGLREMLPEEFGRLPSGDVQKEKFQGTILDPKYKEPMAVRMPTREGGERLMRLPEQGKGLAQRGAFQTEAGKVRGLQQAEKMSIEFDKMLDVATQIRVATGEIAISESQEASTAAANIAGRAMKDMVAEILAIDEGTDEAISAMEEFLATFMPFVQELKGAADIKHYKIYKGGKRELKEEEQTAAQYVKSRRGLTKEATLKQQMLGVQDIMAERSGKVSQVGAGSFYARQGVEQTENVARLGSMYDQSSEGVERLIRVLDVLGVTMEKDAGHVSNLHDQMEKYETGILKQTVGEALGRTEGTVPPETRKYAQAMGGGLSSSEFQTVVAFPTDIGDDLDAVKNRLLALGAAGADVADSLGATEKMMSAQRPEESIPRDVIIISAAEFKKRVQAVSKEQGIPEEEARSRLQRTGLAHRFPTTGPQSFVPARLQVGDVPEGKMGVPIGAAISSTEDLETMIAPLRARLAELNETFEQMRGVGEGADEIRAEMSQLTAEINGVIPSFEAMRLNLDTDGDKMTFHADVATKAGRGIETLTEQARGAGLALESLMTTATSRVTPGAAVESIQDYGALLGEKSKLAGPRGGEFLKEQSPEQIAKEAYAHVAPKKVIGLVTDVFNSVLIGVTTGSKRLKEHLAVSLGEVMKLGSGSAMAQKHGVGAVPTQFGEDLSKGKLGDISKGMEAGGGDFYGALGKLNERYRKDIQQRLRETDEGMVRALGEEEGTGGKGDLLQVIDRLVDRLDIKGSIEQMYEKLKENMREALTGEGMSPGQVDAEMESMLAPKGRKGPKGMDMDKILEHQAKSYTFSRQRFAKNIEQMSPMEQISEVLSVVVGQGLQDSMAQFSLDIGPADLVQAMSGESSRVAGVIHAALKSWLGETLGEFSIVDLQQVMEMAPGLSKKEAGRVKGIHKPGGAGELGEIFIALEKVIRPFAKSLVGLLNVMKGQPSEIPLKDMAKDLAGFPQTFAHEATHKATEGYQVPRSNIMKQLMSGKGAIGRSREDLVGAFIDVKEPRVMAAQEKFQRLEQRKAGGETLTDEGQNLDKALKGAERDRNRIVAGEALAYQSSPQQWAKLTEGLATDAVEALELEFEKLKEAKGELVAKAMAAGRLATSGIMEGLTAALEGRGPAAVTAADVQARQESRLQADYPFRAETMAKSERLGAAGMAVSQGQKAMQIPGELQLPKGMDINTDMKVLGKTIEQYFDGIRDAMGDPGELRALEAKVTKAGGKYTGKMKALQADPKSGAPPDVRPAMEAEQLTRQFRTQTALMYIEQAKGLEANLIELRKHGKAESEEFREQQQAFWAAVDRAAEYLENTQVPIRRGDQLAVISPIAARGGEKVPAAQDVFDVGPSAFKAALSEIGGTGEEGQTFEHMLGPLNKVREAIQRGGDATEEWANVFTALESKPKYFSTNMIKSKEVFSTWAKMSGAKLNSVGQQFEKLSVWARQYNTALAKAPAIKTGADIDRLPPRLGPMTAAGRAGGKDLAGSMADQIKRARASAEAHAKQLTTLIRTDVFQNLADQAKNFEGMQFQIFDPKTQQMALKYGATFKRVGKQIRVSFQQGGAAAGAFGNQMRNAFRRVVQWGFASGIIYGVVRALRNMVQVVTDVQTRIASLAKVMDTSITNFDEMQEGAIGLAKGFGVSINEVLDGMVVYAQQGLKMQEIMERTRSTMMAVNVTTLSTTEATEALTAVMKLFTSEMDSSMTAVDAWAAVAAKHAITAKDLALAVQRSGAAAKTAGVSFNDLLGMTTAIGAVTRQTGKEVATSIKFMMRAMRRPTAQKQLVQLGVQQQDPTGDLKPAMDVLGAVAGKWDDLTRAQQLSTAQAMAGIRHYNAFIVLMENWEEALDASADAQNSQGFSARKNAIAMETFAKQMQVLRETAKGFALDIGKIVLPAMTGLTKLASMAVGAFEVLPDIMKQAGVGIAIGLVGFHKAADMVLDSLDAIMGYGAKQAIKTGKGGMFGAATRGIKNLPALVISAAMAFKGLGKGVFMSLNSLDQFDGSMGRVSQGIFNARAVTMGFIKRLKTLRGAMIGTGVGALIVALGFLAVAFFKTAKSGKDVEDALFDQIGVIQDSVNGLEAQSTKLKKVTHLWGKYESALETAADPGKLAAAIEAGTFKSPEAALKKYKDTLSEVGTAMASLDPSSIEGISETGDYLYSASAGMDALRTSAIDAHKATSSALSIKVITAYGDEITKAKGLWATFVETISFGTTDMSLLKQLEDVREKINALAEARKKMAQSGIAPLHLQDKMNDLVEKELEIRGEILASAGEMVRMLNQMPTFDNQELARTVLNTEKMRKNLEAIAASGVAGREATAGSIRMRQMARNVGLAGVVGMESTANADRLRETVMEQGLRPRAGGAKGEGALGFLDPEAAKQLVLLAQGAKRLAAAGSQGAAAIERARTIITGMDPYGEMVYYFDDALGDMVGAIKESQLTPAMRKIMDEMETIGQAQVEAAQERTRRLLTIQSAGALAGIRVPEGGMPQIGPGMRRELTVEQRVMGKLPEEMQRMAEVQSELTQISKRYNETLAEGTEVGENVAAGMQDRYRIMNMATKHLATALQMENFDLSRLAHIATAMYKLEMSLEAAASAARDANIEEETRAELLRHTAGVMAGMAVAPEMDMGKAFRELTSQERLQVEMPELAGTFQNIGAAQSRYDTQIGTVIDIRKQIADFGQMIGDLEAAGTEMSKEQQTALRAQAADVGRGDVYVADQIQKSAADQLAEMKRQTPLLDKMLDHMQLMAEVSAGADPEEKRDILKKGLQRAEGKDLAGILGAAGPKVLETFVQNMLGVTKMPERKAFKGLYEIIPTNVPDVSEEEQEFLDDMAKRIEGYYEQLSMPGASTEELTAAAKRLQVGMEDLLHFSPGLQSIARKMIQDMAEREVKTKEQQDTENSLLQREELITKIKLMQKEAMGKLVTAQGKAIKHTNETRKLLESKKSWEMVLAAQGLVQAIENTIDGFKKTEMMFYQKKDSDIEGPFARVGKPGFKTDFEKRREDVAEKYRGPMSFEQLKERDKELRDVDFDEKEARIKQQQDIEVAALREQQGQAEKMRDILADAMLKGDLDPGATKMARTFFNTLTDQLAVSEQAEMRGDKLKFKGVSGLGNVRDFVKKMQQQVKTTAAAAASKTEIANIRAGTDPTREAVVRGSANIVSAINAMTHAEEDQAAAAEAPAAAAAAQPDFIGPPAPAPGSDFIGPPAPMPAAPARPGPTDYEAIAAAGGMPVTTRQGAQGPWTIGGGMVDMDARQAAELRKMTDVAGMGMISEVGAPGWTPGPDMRTGAMRAPSFYGPEDEVPRRRGDSAARGGRALTDDELRRGAAYTRDAMRDALKAVAAGDKMMIPTGKFRDTDPTQPVDLTEALKRLTAGQPLYPGGQGMGGRQPITPAPTGVPGDPASILARQTNATRDGMRTGNALAREGGGTISVGGVARADPVPQRREPAAADGEASQALAKAVASLETTLAGLTDLEFDTTSLESSIAVLGTEVVGAVLSELNVNVINTPSVLVTNISEIATAAVAEVGAAVTELQTAIVRLDSELGETVTDVVAALGLDTKITAAETTAQDALDATTTTNDALLALRDELRNADQGLESDIRIVAINADDNANRINVINTESLPIVDQKAKDAHQLALQALAAAQACARV